MADCCGCSELHGCRDCDRRSCGPPSKCAADESGEHVAAAGGRQLRTEQRCGKEVCAVRDESARSFEQHDALRSVGERTCRSEPITDEVELQSVPRAEASGRLGSPRLTLVSPELIIDDDTFLDVESRDAIHFDEPVLVEDDALAADDVAAEEDVDAFAEDQADAFAEDQ